MISSLFTATPAVFSFSFVKVSSMSSPFAASVPVLSSEFSAAGVEAPLSAVPKYLLKRAMLEKWGKAARNSFFATLLLGRSSTRLSTKMRR